MSKATREDPGFRSPPVWIHVSEAGKWLLSRREARKRAVIRLIDNVKPGVGAVAAPKPKL
jgi:hypothetical protein